MICKQTVCRLALAKAAINFSYDDGKKDNGEGKEAFDPDDEKDDGDDADESSDEEVDLGDYWNAVRLININLYCFVIWC